MKGLSFRGLFWIAAVTGVAAFWAVAGVLLYGFVARDTVPEARLSAPPSAASAPAPEDWGGRGSPA